MSATSRSRFAEGIPCGRVRSILSFFLEKETDPLDTLRTRRHLDGCIACRRIADRISVVMQTLSDSLGVSRTLADEGPADIAAGVMARLRSMKSRSLSDGTLEMAAKWSGLLLILTAGTAAILRQGGVGAKFAANPLGSAVSMFGEALDLGRLGDLAAALGAALSRIAEGGTLADLAERIGPDALIPLQIAGSALSIVAALAVPAAALAAWMIRSPRS